jgi:hypothetical protein
MEESDLGVDHLVPRDMVSVHLEGWLDGEVKVGNQDWKGITMVG